ncbi:MAG: acetyl-CoA acetyltransferase, partial [Deltaproteobacteria bacterium]
MKSIKDQVAIIGMGCTQFGELWDKGVDDLIVDACFEAFKDAGIEPGDVDGAWFGSVMSGSTGAALSSPLKLDYIPVTRVENFCATGTDGLRNACYAVAANKCNIALVCGVEKLKDYSGGFPQYTTGSLVTGKTEWDMPPVNFFALLAQRYFY